jgi:hypothetical protein
MTTTRTIQRIAVPPAATVLIAVGTRVSVAQGQVRLPPRESGGRPAPATEEGPR